MEKQYKRINGETIELTQEEIAQIEAEKLAQYEIDCSNKLCSINHCIRRLRDKCTSWFIYDGRPQRFLDEDVVKINRAEKGLTVQALYDPVTLEPIMDGETHVTGKVIDTVNWKYPKFVDGNILPNEWEHVAVTDPLYFKKMEMRGGLNENIAFETERQVLLMIPTEVDQYMAWDYELAFKTKFIELITPYYPVDFPYSISDLYDAVQSWS